MKRVDEESWYHHMRWEHKKRRDKGYYAEQLGVECVNCGSNENKEHKMKKIKNLVDIKRHHHNLVKGEVVGHIEMLDGEIKEMIYEG